MLNWLLRFLICALVIVVVVYVCHLLLAMVTLPEPARIIILLIIAVVCLIAVVRYLGMPPGSGGSIVVLFSLTFEGVLIMKYLCLFLLSAIGCLAFASFEADAAPRGRVIRSRGPALRLNLRAPVLRQRGFSSYGAVNLGVQQYAVQQVQRQVVRQQVQYVPQVVQRQEIQYVPQVFQRVEYEPMLLAAPACDTCSGGVNAGFGLGVGRGFSPGFSLGIGTNRFGGGGRGFGLRIR